jgi:type II secretory pathway component PulM
VNLNPREKLIATIVGAILVLYVGYTWLLAPYLAQRQTLITAIDRANDRDRRESNLLANQPRVAAEWKKLTATTVQTQPAVGSGRINDALQDWARNSRLVMHALKPDRPVQEKDFQKIRFQVSAEGSSDAVSKFLLAVETTDLPLQIDDFRINARKEGVNDLAVELKVTTVVFSPAATTKPGQRPAPAKGDTL